MTTNNYHCIPEEMRQYKQWINWRYEARGGPKPAKVPYNPYTGKLASVTDPNTWANYDYAVSAVPMGYSGIGFVLTKSDPYAFIDLDETEGNQADYARQLKIYKEFDSYSETSPSGKGVHIIIKANIADGRRRNHIELYDDKRYMTMTGNVCNDRPIKERKELAYMLWTQMGGMPRISANIVEGDEKYRDEEIIERGLKAANGEKFRELMEGHWNDKYPSQSEADQAFINMLAFYAPNRGQIKRIFRQLPLGQRDKAKREDYLDKTIDVALKSALPLVDLTSLTANVENFIAGEKEKNASAALPIVHPAVAPKGLLPEIAQFVYDSSPYVVWEIAWATAIALMAGICGRAYNISNTGLNLYILLLAPTGTGKESIKRSITTLLGAVSQSIPAAMDFIGPAYIASGQALAKSVAESSTASFVSILPEVGLQFKQITSDKANTSQAAILSTMLDLYHKSGKNDVLHSMVYSNKKNNIAPVKSPAFTFIGESVPDSFYESIDERMITSGFLPRLTIIEYNGPRPPHNEKHAEAAISTELFTGLEQLVMFVLSRMKGVNLYGHQTQFTPADVTENDSAKEILKSFRVFADEQIRNATSDVIHHLWNRAHLKALKYAALGAISENICQPVITANVAQWAINNATSEIQNLLQRFEKGEIGKDDSENKQMNHLKAKLRDYFLNDASYAMSYGGTAELHRDKIIPRKYLYKRISNLPSFKNDKLKAHGALDRCIDILISIGVLKRYPADELSKKYGTSQQAYLLTDTEYIKE